jgi:RNA polymerase nonessential primary-like sigma factor
MRTNRKQNSTDTVRAYLCEIGRVPLLTNEQEIQYGRQVQQLVYLQSLKQSLIDEMETEPDNAEWAEAAGLDLKELERLLHLGRRAKGKMIEANLRLVVSIAKKYQNRGLELLDLIQEGTLGLNRAAEKFDPAKGYKFSTYATWWIKQAIARGLIDKGRHIRIPVHRCEKMGRYKKSFRKMTQELGRSPSIQEWADAVGESVQGLRELMVQFSTPASLDQPIGESEEATLLDLLDSTDSPDEFVESLDQREQVIALLESLNPRYRGVLAARYGFEDGEEKTLAIIGAELNLSRERVRQIHDKALQSLSELFEAG